MGQIHPVTTMVIERTGNDTVTVGVACAAGRRHSLEDSHAIRLESVGKSRYGFFGVFDGHGGTQCSREVSSRFPKMITFPPSSAQIEEAALSLDYSFVKNETTSGSCATFLVTSATVCREGENIKCKDIGSVDAWVGNIGDSRVIAAHRSTRSSSSSTSSTPTTTTTHVVLTHDHKPHSPKEKIRICAAGGSVVENRVDGKLAVSRAFGDVEYKYCGLTGTSGEGSYVDAVSTLPPSPTSDTYSLLKKLRVTAQPDIVQVKLQKNDFVILCCDGVLERDVFTSDSLVAFVSSKLEETDDVGAIAAAVCAECMKLGSGDNVTCMIALLADGQEYNHKYLAKECLPGPFVHPTQKEFVRTYVDMLSRGEVSLGEALHARYHNGLMSKNELDIFGLKQPNASSDIEWFSTWALQNVDLRFTGETAIVPWWCYGGGNIGPKNSPAMRLVAQSTIPVDHFVTPITMKHKVAFARTSLQMSVCGGLWYGLGQPCDPWSNFALGCVGGGSVQWLWSRQYPKVCWKSMGRHSMYWGAFLSFMNAPLPSTVTLQQQQQQHPAEMTSMSTFFGKGVLSAMGAFCCVKGAMMWGTTAPRVATYLSRNAIIIGAGCVPLCLLKT